MSFNQKRTDANETDDMNIKSHLNASLESDGINVSEDLISRTLAAIKKQEAADEQEAMTIDETKKPGNKENKVIPWKRYILRTASAAAAAVLLIAGINVIRMSGAKKSTSTAYDSAANNVTESTGQDYEMKKDEAALAGGTADSTESQKAKVDESVTATAKSFASENPSEGITDDSQAAADNSNEKESASLKSTREEIKADNPDTDQASASDSKTSTGNEEKDDFGASLNDSKVVAGNEENGATGTVTQPPLDGFTLTAPELKFTDICLIAHDEVETVNIIDHSNHSVVLKEKTAISDFFTVMEKHTYAESTEGTNVNSYTLEIKSSNATDTLILGNNVMVIESLTDSDNATGIYNVTDYNGLIQDINLLITKNQN